jgi:FlaA1/EpsC-like NDP-sugar epimerase
MRDLTALTRRQKAVLVLVTDTALLPFALWMAFGFRLGPFDPASPTGFVDPLAWIDFSDAIIICFGGFLILASFRLYRIKLHAMDMDAIQRLALCSAALALFSATTSFVLQSGSPRSVPFLFGASFFLLAVCVRVSALQTLRSLASYGRQRAPVAIYGAGAAGIQLAASLKQSRELEPIMFVDDNPALHNVIVAGIRVKPFRAVKRAIEQERLRQLLIAIPSLSRARREAITSELSDLKCDVKIIPSYVDLVSGKASVNTLLKVDPNDLLGRDKVDLDAPEIVQTYAGRSVMITGAGGSIGAELCRQVLQCGPNRLILFDSSEPALYQIERDLRHVVVEKGVELQAVLGSVTDRQGVDAALQNHDVDVVLHAAAYKHVPLLETNEVEAARNNILGTSTVVESAMSSGIERLILVSTDKAVRPTNIMGATKSLAELIIYDAQSRSTKTLFSLVRFGNVLGSSGSVVPLFAEQIAKGGPLTVTHPEVARYFMTIPEAARLVLLAGAFAEGDELFVLDMGQPVKIVDLAKRMVELTGRTLVTDDNPDGDIQIQFVGLRPGEKLFEEILVDDNALKATPHSKILRAQMVGLDTQRLESMKLYLQDAIEQRDREAIREIACAYVDGFQPTTNERLHSSFLTT